VAAMYMNELPLAIYYAPKLFEIIAAFIVMKVNVDLPKERQELRHNGPNHS
jgi:hypothetical protein